MRIRRARTTDLAAVLAIANEAAAQGVANFATKAEPLQAWQATFAATQAHYPWFVAESNGAVVGFAKAAPHRPRGAYAFTAEVTVYLAPDARARGIGTALYEALISCLRAQGYATVLAGITLPNPASEALHARFGFQRCAIFHRVGFKHGCYHDVGYYELHLQLGDEALPPVQSVDAVLGGRARRMRSSPA